MPSRPTLESLATRLTVNVQPPSLDDTASDRDRVERAAVAYLAGDKPRWALPALQGLSATLRQSGWHISLQLAEIDGELWIQRVSPAGAAERCLGLAVDVGTTTVSMEVVDLATGETLDAHLAYNGQRQFGTDITSRLMYTERPNGLAALRTAVVGTLDELIDQAVEAAAVSRDDIIAVACAGNTTMTHILLGLNPAAIRREPYVPVTTEFPTVSAQEIGLNLPCDVVIYSLPAISGYVGGDITAGLLSTGIVDDPRLSILIDIGTNGETVLGNQEWLMACSGSAGSAFEGCGLEWGMNATPGAIERVWVEGGQVCYRTVNDEPPRGICGSGLIEGLGTFLAAGIIDRAGKLNSQAPGVRQGEYHPEIVLAAAADTSTGCDITLRGPDLENLIRDKAALYAGSRMLLNSVGLSFDEVEQVLIAGNFGHSLDVEQAVRIGLLPDIPRDRIRFIGNSSLAGARQALLSAETRQRAHDVARNVTTLELTAEPSYFDEYTAALFLPHTDLTLFPSARV